MHAYIVDQQNCSSERKLMQGWKLWSKNWYQNIKDTTRFTVYTWFTVYNMHWYSPKQSCFNLGQEKTSVFVKKNDLLEYQYRVGIMHSKQMPTWEGRKNLQLRHSTSKWPRSTIRINQKKMDKFNSHDCSEMVFK